MSMNLMTNNPSTDTAASWKAITAIAEKGYVWIDDATVTAIARLLDGNTLANGEKVCSYAFDDDQYASMVIAFGPSLLADEVKAEVRNLLAKSSQPDAAVRLFDEVARMGLQISLCGKEHCPAHIKAVNWIADEVEINRCSGNMYEMLRALGLHLDPTAECGEVDFETFAKAVNDNADLTDSEDRLKAFVACGRRNGATLVYWA